MESCRHSPTPKPCKIENPKIHSRRRSFWWRWFVANTFVSGAFALLWLLLRSGTKPSRFSYPCQQAAISTAALAFGAPLVAAIVAIRRRLPVWIRTPAGIATTSLCLIMTAALWGYFLRAEDYSGPVLTPREDYRARLFHVADCPQDPSGERFLGLDNLLALMGDEGLKLYKSAELSPVSGPDGIIGAGDVVVIKINYQWDQRGGTNVDLLRGLIRRIVDHPDHFAGEVVVCENAQFNSVNNFDRPLNNAQDNALSPHDVVLAFQAEGHNVSHFDWTVLRYTSVAEYSQGNMSNGYIVYPYDADLHGCISYPKFQSAAGTYISLKLGIWNPGSQTYDRERLKFVNLPVLKSHHATYGATACVKHYMGVVTRELSTNSHGAIQYGIMGALQGEIQMADLNILDAIWINANPLSGPQTSYAGATRRDELVASLDPVALDIWAVKNILIPGFLANGHLPPWPSPSADPDLPSSAFRQYLDHSMNQLLAAGCDVTNDLAQIDVLTRNGGAGDFDGDSDVDLADYEQFALCFTGPDGGPLSPECSAGDFDGDDDIDCEDWDLFRVVWTAAGSPPSLPDCPATGVPENAPAFRSRLSHVFPNPGNPSVTISYTLGAAGSVKLRIFDVSGRAVRTLVHGAQDIGEHAAIWDGRDDHGSPASSGAYSAMLDAPGCTASEKVMLLR